MLIQKVSLNLLTDDDSKLVHRCELSHVCLFICIFNIGSQSHLYLVSKVHFIVNLHFLIEDNLFAIKQEHLRLIVLLKENDLFLNCRI